MKEDWKWAGHEITLEIEDILDKIKIKIIKFNLPKNANWTDHHFAHEQKNVVEFNKNIKPANLMLNTRSIRTTKAKVQT